MQSIQARLRKASHRNRFEIIFKCAQPKTLLDAIEDEEPEIVHFCGHGSAAGIILEGESGDSSLVPTDVLEMLFERAKTYVKCVLLNACHSEMQARAISKHILYTIGMEGEILDGAAIAFAGAFYKGLGKGESIESAFNGGHLAARLINASEVPKLFRKNSPSFSRRALNVVQYGTLSLTKAATNINRRVLLLIALACLAFVVAIALPQLGNQQSSVSPPGLPSNLSSGTNEMSISSGEILILPEDAYENGSLDFAEQGAEDFVAASTGNESYNDAVISFGEAIEADRNNPEPYIYRNNAIARRRLAEESRKKYVLAVAVPANTQDNNEDRAEEILRGIADAQACYNGLETERENYCPPGSTYSLEIRIADDKNTYDGARKVAEAAASDDEVVGIIGHYASERTADALPIYSRNNIPVISSGSTSSTIEDDNFYRTTASTAKLGERLAAYTETQGITKVFVFVDNPDKYSRTAGSDFEKALRRREIEYERISFTSEWNIEDSVDSNSSTEKIAVAIFPPSTLTSSFENEPERDRRVLEVAEQIKPRGNILLLGGSALFSASTSLEPSDSLEPLAFEDMVLAVPWFAADFSDQDSYATLSGKKWGGDINFFTASSYDAVQVFMEALSDIDNEALNNEEVRTRLLETLDSVRLPARYTSGLTALPELEFSESREPNREAVLVRIVPKELGDGYKFQRVPDS